MLPISVCIIAKNEEQHIEECLQRLAVYDWEIIVVDTGSTDKTIEIAQKYTPNVHHFEWAQDFSAARNYAISLAQNDYILSVDCDEYLESNDKTSELLARLTAQIKPTQIGMINLFHALTDHSEDSIVHDQVARFFHRKYTHYYGTIHEQLVLINHGALDFVPIPLSFHHVGYHSPELKRKKAQRNIVFLEKALALTPSDPYLLFQLGQTYFGLEDYKAALPFFERALEQDVNEQEPYVQLLVESYGYCLLQLQQYARALELEGIYSTFSKRADFVFLMGLIYMNNACFDKAIDTFREATEIAEYSAEGVNSYKAFYNIGIIYECMGKQDLAIPYYKQCQNYAPALERLAQCNIERC